MGEEKVVRFKCNRCGMVLEVPEVVFPEPGDAPICCGGPMKRIRKG